MVSKTATTVTVLRSQHSLGNKSHNGKKSSKQERNGKATSQMDVRARENLFCLLASLVFSIAAAQSTPVSQLQIHPGLCFPGPQPGTLHELGDPKQMQTHTGCRRKTARAGGGESFCYASLSPSHLGDGDTRKWPFPHCGRTLSVCFFPIIRVVGPSHSYVFNPTGCQKTLKHWKATSDFQF